MASASGVRAVPARTTTNDETIGCRLDFGPKLAGDKRQYNFQLNKNARNTSVKKLAQKNSHKVWSEAEIQQKSEPTDSESKTIVEGFFDKLESNMKT
ncbi:hypothetical protein B0T26DRAFT_729017 [Lasiosphaeria miniovina]|uniref:Uncharacterized protein n=1 Tax=Lasiosphaeria miniovina TaxID=1954250 RepID=A0AA40DMW3_9PEZI|nr:uncharacterized protein B0T26DRAFT_729017 [Lasiosphaeria miniovina]KAK0707061.1 hypothetical protein B0T26DRAFT_729017 [Lasiosphaeria miniovina]